MSEELVPPIPPNGQQVKVNAPQQLSAGVLQENAWLWTLQGCMEPNTTISFDAKGSIFASHCNKCAEHTLL